MIGHQTGAFGHPLAQPGEEFAAGLAIGSIQADPEPQTVFVDPVRLVVAVTVGAIEHAHHAAGAIFYLPELRLESLGAAVTEHTIRDVDHGRESI